jgi:diaminopimelate epimerase
MDSIAFTKMSGSGNDFILIDNRARVVDELELPGFITGICRRRVSVGADGVILIEASATADFRWRFFNADGSPAEMCGNGARCAARFAFIHGIAGADMRFETEAGVIHARVDEPRVRVKLTDPHGLRQAVRLELASGPLEVSAINTGVPHVVVMASDLENTDVRGLGREIRRHPEFAPAGTNVSFIRADPDGGIAIRTYERGVEDETLACGTGAVAGALVAAFTLNLASPVGVATRSGEHLTVHFQRDGGRFHDIYQEGCARLIYAGHLCAEAWR